ncbi:MAG: hypothetical protein H6592_03935 [Flavobacteriales bacterium]|nr:hypothetical protein [Flavobacteriales bacterium]
MLRRRRSALSNPLLLLLFAGVIGMVIYWFVPSRSGSNIDLTGTWVLTNKVTGTTYRKYMDDTHEFRIEVVQTGDVLEGRGVQSRYNDKPARNRYPIWFTQAEIKDDLVAINYGMKGSREFTGTFTLKVDKDDPTLLRGTFTSAAANTTGTTEVRVVRD